MLDNCALNLNVACVCVCVCVRACVLRVCAGAVTEASQSLPLPARTLARTKSQTSTLFYTSEMCVKRYLHVQNDRHKGTCTYKMTDINL